MSDDAPIHECESEIDHYTGHYVPYSLRRVCGFFNVPQIYYMCKGLWDGVYGLSSLSERTRKSNRLQMLLQRQHLFLSYLKTLSVGPAGFEQTASHSVDRRLSHWANRANIRGCPDLLPGNHSLGTDSKWCSVDTESHTDRFNSCRGLSFFLCPVLVTCWLHHFT